MPRARKQDTTPAGEVPAPVSDMDESTVTEGEAETAGSEEVMVVRTTEEPVRRGGHILTENGWVPEDLVPEPEAEQDKPADDPESEQE